jgi:hypothetical protein
VAAEGEAVLVQQPVSGQLMERETVSIPFAGRDLARGFVLTQWATDRGKELGSAVAATGGFHRRVRYGARLLGHHVDGPTDHVLAVQGALRSPQDLHPLEIVEIDIERTGSADIDLVDEDHHRVVP